MNSDRGIMYRKYVLELLKNYKLTKAEKALIAEQIFEVVSELDEENLPDEHEFLMEIFDLNDIEPKVKTNRASFSLFRVLIGLFIIVIGIFLGLGLDFNQSFINILLIFEIGIFIFTALNRRISGSLFWLLVILYTFNSEANLFELVPFYIAFISFLLINFGFRIIFLRKNKRHQFNHHHGHSFQSQKLKDSFNNTFESSKFQENENFYIINKFNNHEMTLYDESISYIDIENSYGNCEIDLRTFTFPLGSLTININNYMGNCVIIIDRNTRVLETMSNSMGNIECPKGGDEKTVYLMGSNKFGNLEVKIK